ncbi:MAG TPA: glycosyltransferase family 4 protein [Acidimicrobiia bacterium]|nr:glycosyltransferase family 4 protein [Acidimicrobiia bacterium]
MEGRLDQPSARAPVVGFVVPRYGADVAGGAEAVVRELAEGLAARGHAIEVLTSCARDHTTWRNEYPAGVSVVEGVTVRRFPAVVSRTRTTRVLFNRAIAAGSPLRLDEQDRWLNDDARVPRLFEYLVDHGRRYRALVLAPYLYWTTVAAAQAWTERSVLMPCLHDEPEAGLEVFRPLFTTVRGIWFLSEPEARLAARLHPDLADHRVIGSGVRPPTAYDAARFRKRYGIEGRFVLYAGRREAGKGWDELLAGFGAACERAALPFSLVTMGAVPVHTSGALAERVVDLGFVPPEDRDDACAAADAVLQPSRYESFSRTIMEAWLAGTFVIANGASAVNRWHCERAGAGLLYDDDLELEQCLRFVADAPDAAAALGAAGRVYALETANWSAVLDRTEAALDTWFPPALPSSTSDEES